MATPFNAQVSVQPGHWLHALPSAAQQSQTMVVMDRAALELLLTREMPFGKHKGCLVADLPANYLQWFAREGFPPGEIGRLLALMFEIDHNGLQHLLAPLRPVGARGRNRRRAGG